MAVCLIGRTTTLQFVLINGPKLIAAFPCPNLMRSTVCTWIIFHAVPPSQGREGVSLTVLTSTSVIDPIQIMLLTNEQLHLSYKILWENEKHLVVINR